MLKICKKLVTFITVMKIQLPKKNPTFSFYCSESLIEYLKIFKNAGLFLSYTSETVPHKFCKVLKITIYKHPSISHRIIPIDIIFNTDKKIWSLSKIKKLVIGNNNKLFIFKTIDNQLLDHKSFLTVGKIGGLLQVIMIF